MDNIYQARRDALIARFDEWDIDGFIIPISDEHMSEYIGDYAQRLQWLTGFGGSAGMAVVLRGKSAIFVDGRYTEQVQDQVDGDVFSYERFTAANVGAWIGDHAPVQGKIGYDSWIQSRKWADHLSATTMEKGIVIKALHMNPIDALWEDRPQYPDAPLHVQSLEHSGKSVRDKRADIARWLHENNVDAVVLSALDSVAWLFNIRGGDIANTPVALSYAIVGADGQAQIFVDPAKLNEAVRAHLGNEVVVADYNDFSGALTQLSGKKVAIDPDRSVAAIHHRLEEVNAEIIEKRDPVVLAKAIKNETEIRGHKKAQHMDGIAVTRFLHFMAKEAHKGGLDELSAARRLKEYRELSPELRDLSFRTISAAGPHGALPHYSVNEQSNAPIRRGSLYLVDSGGQYPGGTTDITRVVAVGEPSDEMRKRYTQVLKGHIALDQAVFPVGTSGGQLDILARQYLWADGVDYAHGTGHGVGSYLSVHEGPQRIATFGGMNEPLRPGMILSNEPGYYKSGEFGIRIENLILVEPRYIEGAEHTMLGFATLTFVPLERELIDKNGLSDAQIKWVDNYHEQVMARVGPALDEEDHKWLVGRCAPL